MDKSTQVVIENHTDLEKIYQEAEQSRNFKEAPKDTARVVLQSVYTLALCLLWWKL